MCALIGNRPDVAVEILATMGYEWVFRPSHWLGTGVSVYGIQKISYFAGMKHGFRWNRFFRCEIYPNSKRGGMKKRFSSEIITLLSGFLLFSKFARCVIQNPWAISLGLINLFLFILPELFVTFTLGSAAFCLFWFHQGYLLLLRFHLQPCGKRRNQNVLAVTGWFNFNR